MATESGILHEMQKSCPDVEFIPVPPEFTERVGDGTAQPIANQCSCNECEYMRMNTLQKLHDCLRNETNEVFVDEAIAKDAIRPIQRMLEMS